MKKPEPVVTSQACSLCGLDWNRHGDKPTAETCITLLRADLAARPIAPYWLPSTWEPKPWWQNPIISYTSSTGTSATLTLIQDDDEPPEALPAAV